MPAPTAVLSLRLPESEKNGLERLARRQGRSVSETAARLITEGRRRAEFAGVDFRDTPAGRLACVQGTRLQVWHVVRLARQFNGDAQKVAEHLDLPFAQVQAALNYAAAFAEEIEAAIRDYESLTVEEVKRQLPQLEVFEAKAPRARRGRQ
jgi:uncharacterized protein (DUF433 family)